MGFVLKSALGLGVVYYAIFARGPHGDVVPPVASSCATAARVAVAGGGDLRGTFATLNCATALNSEAQKLAGAQKLAAPPPPASPAPAPVAAKPQAAPASTLRGSLTEADLETPWFGPTHALRKGLRG